MRRSTLAVLLLTGIAVAACAKKSSLYLDSGQPGPSRPPSPKAAPPSTAASPTAEAPKPSP